MIIYPSLDLMEGRSVRLYQGAFNKITIYEKDPLVIAKTYAEAGAQTLHIVDLDGAKSSQFRNVDVILKIRKHTNLSLQVGGGIRTQEQVAYLLQQGIDKVVIGSVAINSPSTVKKWISTFGAEKFVLALDIHGIANSPMLATHGWQILSNKLLWDILDEYAELSVRQILCTDISRDGTLEGPNLELYRICLQRYPKLSLQASGGIASLNDLIELAKVPVAAAIVGKAFYDERFSFEEALREVENVS